MQRNLISKLLNKWKISHVKINNSKKPNFHRIIHTLKVLQKKLPKIKSIRIFKTEKKCLIWMILPMKNKWTLNSIWVPEVKDQIDNLIVKMQIKEVKILIWWKKEKILWFSKHNLRKKRKSKKVLSRIIFNLLRIKYQNIAV